MDDDESKVDDISPELQEFMEEPMSRIEVIRLLQPLRSAILSTFHGSMTSLGLIAQQATDAEARDKAIKTFKELNQVFAEIEAFDVRLGRLLKGDPLWAHKGEDGVDG